MLRKPSKKKVKFFTLWSDLNIIHEKALVAYIQGSIRILISTTIPNMNRFVIGSVHNWWSLFIYFLFLYPWYCFDRRMSSLSSTRHVSSLSPSPPSFNFRLILANLDKPFIYTSQSLVRANIYFFLGENKTIFLTLVFEQFDSHIMTMQCTTYI